MKKVAFFDNDEILDDRSQFQGVEGPCLVIFNDDRVAHSYVPVYDYRIPCVPSLSLISATLRGGGILRPGNNLLKQL